MKQKNYTPLFEDFWKLYREAGGSGSAKQPAFKAWTALGADEDLLLPRKIREDLLHRKRLGWFRIRRSSLLFGSYLSTGRYDDEGIENECRRDSDGKPVPPPKKRELTFTREEVIHQYNKSAKCLGIAPKQEDETLAEFNHRLGMAQLDNLEGGRSWL